MDQGHFTAPPSPNTAPRLSTKPLGLGAANGVKDLRRFNTPPFATKKALTPSLATVGAVMELYDMGAH